VGHSYALPVVKLLFATARTCAYPRCAIPLVFIDEERDVREIAVQIAHIRSPKANGPRHDRGYPRDELNSDADLLLLCGVHHYPVDRNGSKYTTEELLAWKEAQIAEGGGFTVQDDEIRDLAARLESLLGELVQATRLQMQASFVGGRLGFPAEPVVVLIPLEGLEDAEHEKAQREKGRVFRPGRLIGVEVVNRGSVGAEVRAAGIDIDHGPAQGPWRYVFAANNLTPWQFPCRVEGHSSQDWFETEQSIREFTDGLYRSRGLVPRRFRAWAELGNGDRLAGEWLARADLPIWEPGIGEAELRARYNEPA
jgi:hypothetical protein